MGSRVQASPAQSTGSGAAAKARGAKQAGRRRSRESEEERSPREESGAEEEADEPSAKRSVHALQHLQVFLHTLLHQSKISCLLRKQLSFQLGHLGRAVDDNDRTVTL